MTVAGAVLAPFQQILRKDNELIPSKVLCKYPQHVSVYKYLMALCCFFRTTPSHCFRLSAIFKKLCLQHKQMGLWLRPDTAGMIGISLLSDFVPQ